MGSFLLTTTFPNPLMGRKSSLSSFLPSSSSLSSILCSNVQFIKRSGIGKVTTKTSSSIMASVSKRGTGNSNVVEENSVAEVVPDEVIPEVSWKNVQYKAGSIGNRKTPLPVVNEKKQMEYIEKILGSKVYDVAVETPMQLAPILSSKLKINLWLKREDTQPTFSFKIRGAYNMISQLTEEELKKGVICASAGNHAQGVALAARRLKTTALVVMPKTAPKIKIEAVQRLGGHVKLWGETLAEAKEKAEQLSVTDDLVFIPPDHVDVIAGQGTVGMEIARQMRGNLHAIFVPVGSGSQVCGIANFYKLIYPKVKIYGVQLHDQNAMAQALVLGHRVNVIDMGHFADGVAVQLVGEEAFRICNEFLDDVILVDKHLISAAITDMFNDGRSILEPAGALSIAAAKAYCEVNGIEGVNIVAVTSGANMNFDQLSEISDLANVDQSIIASILPEKTGSLQKLAALINELEINITEMTYRFCEASHDAMVFYKVEAIGSKFENMVKKLNDAGFKTYTLSDNPVVTDHLCYMTGGRAHVENETLFRFTFPEKQGALMHFLEGFQPNWNISLFHHRQQGILSSDVLVGVQMEKSEEKKFHDYIRSVGYKYDETSPDDIFHILIQP